MDFLNPDPADQIPQGSTMFSSAISVPLLAGENMLGMFSIVYKKRQNWNEQDLDYLLSIGQVDFLFRLPGIMITLLHLVLV